MAAEKLIVGNDECESGRHRDGVAPVESALAYSHGFSFRVVCVRKTPGIAWKNEWSEGSLCMENVRKSLNQMLQCEYGNGVLPQVASIDAKDNKKLYKVPNASQSSSHDMELTKKFYGWIAVILLTVKTTHSTMYFYY